MSRRPPAGPPGASTPLPGAARLLGAFAWLRWRSLVNGLTSRRRKASHRFPAWAELLGRGVLLVAAGSGALGLAAVALLLPWGIVKGNGELPVVLHLLLRGGLAVYTLALVLIPAFRGFSGGSYGRTRLLLLPIHLPRLHAVEVGAHLSDPWLLLVAPALVALGLGTAAVAGIGAVPVLLAGALLLLVLAALSATASFAVELVLRDRRRAEAVALVLMLVWVSAATLPGLLSGRRQAEEEAAGKAAPATQQAPPASQPEAPSGQQEPPPASQPEPPSAAQESPQKGPPLFPLWLQWIPSEAYTKAVMQAVAGRPLAALAPTAVLAAIAWALLALSRALWRRLLGSPASTGGRSTAAGIPRPLRLPGLSPGASAVAWAQLRGLVRSPPGRLSLVTVPMSALVLTLVSRSALQPGTAASADGPGMLASLSPSVLGGLLVLAAAMVALLSVLSFAVNAFASDGAGYTLTLLEPVDRREWVVAKAAAGGLFAAGQMLLATTVVVVLAPVALPFWPAVLLVGLAAYGWLAPLNAWLSMLLPKAVDLGRLGKRSQPNQLAALVGFFATSVAVAVPASLGAAVFALSESVLAVTGVLVLWAGATAFAAVGLLGLAARTLAGREEAIYLALLDRE